MEELENRIKEVFENYCEVYSGILKSGFKPWANDDEHSIHETNQVANFILMYKNKRESSIASIEFTIPYYDKISKSYKIDRVDGLIVDNDIVIFIEAKRFSRGTKINGLKRDLESINEIISTDNDWRRKLKERLPEKDKTYKCYCLLLADFWKDHNTGIQQKYMNGDSLMWNEIWLDYQAEIVKTVSEVAMVDKSYLVSDGSSNDSKIQKNIYNDKYSIAFALFKLHDF